MDTFSHLKGSAHSPFGWDRKQAAQDLFVLVSALLIVAWIAYEIRIFGSLVADLPPGKEIDLYEAVFLGGVLCICLWIFSWRRLKELRQEANRRVLAEERAADAELRALRDPLTGLGNRAQFDARLEDLVGGMNNRKGEIRTAALFLLDLNHFKQVNDQLGHPVGDTVLRIVAMRLRSVVRAEDVVCRLGGDEFAVVACGVTSVSGFAEGLISAIDQPMNVDGHAVRIGVSVGIASDPGTSKAPRAFLQMADRALYAAKKRINSNLRSAFEIAEPDTPGPGSSETRTQTRPVGRSATSPPR